MHHCNDCDQELTADNWSPSYQRDRIYVCRPCAVVRTATYEKRLPDRRKQYNRKYYEAHREEFATRAKAYQRTHPEKTREWARRSAHKNRAKRTIRQREWRQRHLERLAAKAKAKRDALRKETLAAYGDACKCCGEQRPEFLAIDHINGDGAAHRREIAGVNRLFGGTQIYNWLKKRGFPQDRFRLLCHNCNFSRGCYGYCPHEREKAAL